MNAPLKLLIVLAVAGLGVGATALKNRDQPATKTTAPPVAGQSLPKLLDLGATKCIPCIKMALILEELRKEYAAMFTTEFIDVWKNPVAGKQHGVEMISTQIFYDAQGKEDILNKWKELGIQFAAGEQQRSATLFRGQMLCGPLRLWQTVR